VVLVSLQVDLNRSNGKSWTMAADRNGREKGARLMLGARGQFFSKMSLRTFSTIAALL